MPKALSSDLRQRVVDSYAKGDATLEEVAEQFAISSRSLIRWRNLEQTTGDVETRPRGGGRQSKITEEGLKKLKRLVDKHPDATLKELCALCEDETGVEVGKSIVDRALAKLGISRKKTLQPTERRDDRVRLMRALFGFARARWAPEQLVFFDETGVNLSMTRVYGRAEQGQRVQGHAPKNWGGNATVAAAIRLGDLDAPLLLSGSMTTLAFEAYVEQFLLPFLRPGDVVLMDNLSAHKSATAAQLIESVGASLVFLPPYSYDLNPIELAWSKVKQVLRSASPRTLVELEVAVVQALCSVTPTDIQHWFRHCGYN